MMEEDTEEKLPVESPALLAYFTNSTFKFSSRLCTVGRKRLELMKLETTIGLKVLSYIFEESQLTVKDTEHRWKIKYLFSS